MVDIASLKRWVKGGLLLEDSAFQELRDAPDGVARGLGLLVTIALVVGLVVSLAGFAMSATTSPAEEIDQAMAGVSQAFEQMGRMGVFGDEAVAETVLENIKAGMAMGLGIAKVVEETTPAPNVVVKLSEALGQWLSWPFSWIALWLGWGVLTLLFARMLGGTARIQEMLAATSLVAAPHLLDALGWVPCAGALLGLVAWLWGLAVYVKATAVANRMGSGMALLAVFMPVALALALGTVLFLMVVFAIGVAAGGN